MADATTGEDPSAEPAEPAGPVAWKAAASSIPRLRQRPAASEQPEALDSFQGFAQDAVMAGSAAPGGGAGVAARDPLDSETGAPVMPLDREPPFWAEWVDRVRYLPLPVTIGIGAILAIGAATYLLWPRGTARVSLAQIRQHPEAFEGRSVRVGGRAGETFSVGGRYVFNLLQGRDTVVVYSRTRRPRLHERVTVDGMVSIGYLEGSPRVAVLEDPATP
jgi:hypothetical protein